MSVLLVDVPDRRFLEHERPPLTLRGTWSFQQARELHTIGASEAFRRCPQQLHQLHHTPSLGHDPEFRCVPVPCSLQPRTTRPSVQL